MPSKPLLEMNQSPRNGVSACSVGGQATFIVGQRIRRYLSTAFRACPCFGSGKKPAPDAQLPQILIDIPAFHVANRPRVATDGVWMDRSLHEAAKAARGPNGDEHGLVVTVGKDVGNLGFQRTGGTLGPQGASQAQPFIVITGLDRASLHGSRVAHLTAGSTSILNGRRPDVRSGGGPSTLPMVREAIRAGQAGWNGERGYVLTECKCLSTGSRAMDQPVAMTDDAPQCPRCGYTLLGLSPVRGWRLNKNKPPALFCE